MQAERFDAPLPDRLITPEEAALEAREYELAGKVAGALDAKYPGHMWLVTVASGVTYVRNLALEGMWGFVLHNHKVVNEGIDRAAMKAGGELLERFRISRGRGGSNQAKDFLLERMQNQALKLPEWAR